jgi:8-oxo-dGTP diphosphatase
MRARIIEMADVRAVEAAGGLVCRPGPAGLLEVAIIHRPAYDDWSFPKGKIERNESAEAAALREVTEETGFTCELLEPFACTRYRDRRGAAKTACYWVMRAVEGVFRPSAEVDDLRWLTVDEAVALLSYPHDRVMLLTLEHLAETG